MRNPLTVIRMLSAGMKVVRDPTRLDEVIDLADDLSTPAELEPIVQHEQRQPDGARALAERPRVRVNLDELERLPAGTLGRELADSMRAQGLDPADLPVRPAHDPYSFVRAHLYETHDIWHVVTGFGTDVAGELGLQAFYQAQLPGRLPALLLALGMTNTFMYAFDDRSARMEQIIRGWELGKRARPLFGVDWSQLWHLPLTELRARFDIPASRFVD